MMVSDFGVLQKVFLFSAADRLCDGVLQRAGTQEICEEEGYK